MRILIFLFTASFFSLIGQTNTSAARLKADSLRVLINQSQFPARDTLLDAFYDMSDVFIFQEDEMQWANDGIDFYEKNKDKSIETQERFYSYLKMRAYYFSRKSDYENMATDAIAIRNGISKIVEPSKKLLGIQGKANLYLAMLSHSRGETEASIASMKDAKKVFEMLRDTYNIAQCWKGLANRYTRIKQHDESFRCMDQAALLFEKINDQVEVLRTKNALAAIYYDDERWAEAIDILEKNIEPMKAIQHPSLGYTYVDLAWCLSKMNNIEAARKYILEAEPSIINSDNLHLKGVFFQTASETEESAGNYAAALEYQKSWRLVQYEMDQSLMKSAKIESEGNAAIDEKIVELEQLIAGEKQKTWKKIAAAVGWTALLSALFAFFFYRKKEKEMAAALEKMQTILDEKSVEKESTKEIHLEWDDTNQYKPKTKEQSSGELFLHLFTTKVQGRIGDSDLSVESLAESMKMSRVALFNRTKAATGGTPPSTLIRIIRLETARRLLTLENKTVQEASDAVGFSNPNNFSRAFKKQFGVSPSEVS